MKQKQCPLFKECLEFRSKQLQEADKTTCYCPSWLLNNHKECPNYHPELRPQPIKKKYTQARKTNEDFREEAKKQVSKETTRMDIVERCIEEGIKDKKRILKRLEETFPKVDRKHLRYSIYNYFYNKGKGGYNNNER